MYGYEHIKTALTKLRADEMSAPKPCPHMLEQLEKWEALAGDDYEGMSSDDVVFILINGYALTADYTNEQWQRPEA